MAALLFQIRLVDTDGVCQQDSRAIAVPHSYKSRIQVRSNLEASSITKDRQCPPGLFWMMFELCYEEAYDYRFIPGSWRKLRETNDLRFHEWEVQWLIGPPSLLSF